MTCECQRTIPGPNGSMLRDQSERNFKLIDGLFITRGNEMTDEELDKFGEGIEDRPVGGFNYPVAKPIEQCGEGTTIAEETK